MIPRVIAITITITHFMREDISERPSVLRDIWSGQGVTSPKRR